MIFVKPGEIRNFTVDSAPTGLAGQIGWRLEDENDQVIVARTTTGTIEFATGAYRKAITLPDEKGTYVVIVDFPSTVEMTIDVQVNYSAAAEATGEIFATQQDVERRLGRELDDPERDQVDDALQIVAGLIREAADKAEDWTPSPVPTVFKTLSIEKTIGVIANPLNVAAESEQLGALQRSQTFPRSLDSGIFLTKAEKRDVRRAAEVAGLGAVEYEAWPEAVGASLDFDPFPPESEGPES